MTPTEAAWLAGIMDGDGYIGIVRAFSPRGLKKVIYKLVVTVVMTHERTIRQIHNLLKVGSVGYVKYSPQRPNQRPQWRWSASGVGAEHVVQTVVPFLVTKRAQAAVALEFRNIRYNQHYFGPHPQPRHYNEELSFARDSYYLEMRKLTQRGMAKRPLHVSN